MGRNLFHRSLKEELPLVVGGQGLELVAADGRRYLDACGGAAVSCLGHGHPAVIDAIMRQVQQLEYAHTSFFTNAAAEELAESIAASCPQPLERVYFVGGGSEAVETALKMCRQYHLERGQPSRSRLISRRQSYHGNTLGALAAGGNAARRAPYEPLLTDVTLIDPCFEYHYAQPHESAAEYAARAAAQLEAEIQRLGPGNVMAFIAETVVGATAGAVPPVPGYFRHIREICDRHGVLLILDEVMCGTGRCGSFLACEQDGIVPDLVTLAKGLGAGYQPIGAVVCSKQIHDTFARGSGAFQHGHTYSAHAVACAAALAVQRVIREEDLLVRVRTTGEYLTEALHHRFAGHPEVGDIRGRGLLQAIELVRDRRSRTPFDPALRLHARIRRAAFELGLMVYPGGGTLDGWQGDHVLLAPPYNTTHAQIDEIVERLERALTAVMHALPERMSHV
jgi:adenosylmethionine-8-amino-7-oxononanoate aminotransferase